MRRRRQAFSETERLDMSQMAWRWLWENTLFRQAQTIFLYLGFGSEMETAGLAEECWKQGKRTAFPESDRSKANGIFLRDSAEQF
ncbi:MAG: 5-formyltetrahydrofolate cyclo-ligase [Clostridia bacterium]